MADGIFLRRRRAVPLATTILAVLIGGCASKGRIPVSEVVVLSQQGLPPTRIIRDISQSGTVYRLTDAQVEKLRSQGVSEAVIQYMRQTSQDAITANPQLESWNGWSQSSDGFFYGQADWTDHD